MGEARKDSEQSQSGFQPDARMEQVQYLAERLVTCRVHLTTRNQVPTWLEVIHEQGVLVADISQDILNARSSLWFSAGAQYKPVSQEAIEAGDENGPPPYPSLDLSYPAPAEPLMATARETRRVCYSISRGSTQQADSLEDLFTRLADQHPIRSLAIPLFFNTGDMNPGSPVFGVFALERLDGSHFSSDELKLIDRLTGQIRIGLFTTHQMMVDELRLDQYTTLLDVSRVIASVLDQDALLDQVVEIIQQRLGYPYVHLFSVHPGRRLIFYEAGSGARSHLMRQSQFTIDLDDEPGIIPWVGRNGETVMTNDVRLEPRYRSEPYPPRETRSELTVPLKFGGKVLGIMDIQSDQFNAFTEQDKFLIEGLADNIAVALRNAYLYRSEQWRRQVADSLREVAGLLSADVNLDKVLNAILAELERNLPCDLATIWLLDENQSDAEGEIDLPPLQLVAAHGLGEFIIDLEIGQYLADLFTSDTQKVQVFEDPDYVNWLFEASESEQPIIHSHRSEKESQPNAIDFTGSYSAIAAPLKVGTQKLGVLTLLHHSYGRYGEEAQAMTSAFASYAAVAIENTRLYEAAHEQAWISTVMLQVTDATQKITDLRDLVETVVRITPTVAGVGACMLYLYEEGVFVPAAAAGLNPEQQYEFERWRFTDQDVPALARILEEHNPTLLDEGTDDLRMASNLFVGLDGNYLLTEDLYILVPLLAREEVLGVMLLTYQVDIFKGDSQYALDVFFDQKLPIIQGIAHQTSVSIENARLLHAQREEAYVSVALLQVAQAIVRSTAMDDVLEMIVRITPILTGVRRAAIYLYRPQSALYELMQSYGLPRENEGLLFEHNEFAALDAVRETLSLVALPLEMEWDESGDILDAWTCLSLLPETSFESLLLAEHPLLLAFPLVVQNEFLGILMVEEPEPGQKDIFSGERSYRRLREKRLEIITGISQQASLAIQNARLQLDMVEQERLEKELQLARGIQESFLPKQVPDTQGWEVVVSWEPAREVGGDFYDCFVLPGNRVGVVLGDVADKGMPAALYMTMVITLIKAAVQEADSPAAVMTKINDVLAANSEGGMFVTLFYAVFSQESSQFIYANAGHVPPFLIRSKAVELIPLKRTGMALGVEADSRVEQESIRMDRGDYLVVYTDGVTEAASPGGELYGEKQLMAVLSTAVHSLNDLDGADASPSFIMDEIVQSVTDFVEGSTQSDDLSLVVVKRL